MKWYPSIPKFDKSYLGKNCIAFYKYDGSNLRVEYSRKTGWYKWGKRNFLFDENDPDFAEAIPVFERDFAEPLAKTICDKFKNPDSAIVYLEFFGPHTFSGMHDPKLLGVDHNDPKELVLFDVNIFKKGFVSPVDFRKIFGNFKIAKTVYEGKLTENFVEDIRENKYSINEGVICKGGERHNLWMCKIKTIQYLEKLKERGLPE